MNSIKHLEDKYRVARYELIKQCDGDELRFYLYLKLYAINKHEAFPSYRTLQKELGWNSTKISRLIKKMVKSGRLKIGKKKAETSGGKQAVNIYDITWYDVVNNKGITPKGAIVLNKGATEMQLPFYTIQGATEMQAERLSTNRKERGPIFNKLTDRPTEPIKQTKEDLQRLTKLAEMKKFLAQKLSANRL